MPEIPQKNQHYPLLDALGQHCFVCPELDEKSSLRRLTEKTNKFRPIQAKELLMGDPSLVLPSDIETLILTACKEHHKAITLLINMLKTEKDKGVLEIIEFVKEKFRKIQK